MGKQISAVEWIEGYLKKFNHIDESLSLRKAFEQAKKMERKQIIDAYENGLYDGDGRNRSHYNMNAEQYYNETFKSE